MHGSGIPIWFFIGVLLAVYGATPLPKEEPVPFYKNVWLWAILAVCIFATLNILFW